MKLFFSKLHKCNACKAVPGHVEQHFPGDGGSGLGQGGRGQNTTRQSTVKSMYTNNVLQCWAMYSVDRLSYVRWNMQWF